MVGERGFEPPAPASRRQCSTRLSYSPTGTRFDAIGSRREPRPRLDRGGFREAQPLTAPERPEPLLVPDELLPRRAGTGVGGFGFLDLAPVVIIGRHHAAASEQALEAL